MVRLKLYFLLFCLAVSVPLSYVVWRTYTGVAREELAQLEFFAEALIDDMQKELAELIQREERRAVDEYQTPASEGMASPLSSLPKEPYILGYLQNQPDGRMQTPLVADAGQAPPRHRDVVAALEAVNQAFNQKKRALPPSAPEPRMTRAAKAEPPKTQPSTFAERYLAAPQRKSSQTHLGQKSVRVEELTPRQMSNLAGQAADAVAPRPEAAERVEAEIDAAVETPERRETPAPPAASIRSPESSIPPSDPQRFQVEVAPMQSLFIDSDRVFIFRRVAVNDQILRQGFVLVLAPFLQHMADVYFKPHPMAAFSRLTLAVTGVESQNGTLETGGAARDGRVVAQRTFPAPFDFIRAAIASDHIPASPARKSVHIALAALGAVLLLGLFAIYHSVRSVVDLSERRSRFVSSVTHELKTPLTNIRMYVEMLEQGIAATPQREQEYLGIIGSESTRLSRLINNVLTLAKLEKKQHHVELRPGRLGDLFNEAHAIMAPKLAQEGFDLTIGTGREIEMACDREAMLQVLINLIENSIKFGRNAPDRRIRIDARIEGPWVRIALADTGPGIPRPALKRVFDDFYRAESALTRGTSGTGIGLALVKKLVAAMGGRVEAANNPQTGCTITLRLPLNTRPATSNPR
ncbi:sensor histidine kinase [Desulfatitalea tepidiphila]|uniref:sensor histidine kinase n=1 Tax=Desulfatitalea tepidiphila TaxID=1185843 RepID=UPI0006B55930|nr:HAMP domain-containing sensor histidine kinase [Desulfatitalea tepidiphila]